MKCILALMLLGLSSLGFANCYELNEVAPSHIPSEFCLKKEVPNKELTLLSKDFGTIKLRTKNTLYVNKNMYYISSEGIVHRESENEKCSRGMNLMASFIGFVEYEKVSRDASTFEIIEMQFDDVCENKPKYRTYRYRLVD